MELKNMKWILVIILAFMLFNPPVPKESVAQVENQSCSTSADCTCFGNYAATSGNVTNYGVGVGNCVNNKCDMTYCVDLQPIGSYIMSHTSSFIKNNVGWTVGILGMLLLILFWPRR